MKMDYRFIDKDPVVDMIRTAIHDSGRSLKDISGDSFVSSKTLSKWIYGEVKKPQSFTIFKVCKALRIRVEYVYTDSGSSVLVKEDLIEKYKK